jgi:hypothetical protein
MKRGRPPKDIIDDASPRPEPEPLDDAVTLQKLDRLQAPDPDEEAASTLAKVAAVPEQKREDVLRVMRARLKRMRSYVAGQQEDIDW